MSKRILVFLEGELATSNEQPEVVYGEVASEGVGADGFGEGDHTLLCLDDGCEFAVPAANIMEVVEVS